MNEIYNVLYTGALVIIGLLLICCLIRAIRGPRIADRVIAANMTGNAAGNIGRIVTAAFRSFCRQIRL